MGKQWFKAPDIAPAVSGAVRAWAASLAVLAALGVAIPAQAAGLNDTGQTTCYSGAPCTDDANYGRDAAATAGVLAKIGNGDAGFDFTKIANDGSTLSDSASLGFNPTDWACTRDNNTGLEWEIRTTDPGAADLLRHTGWTYSWYNADNSQNGGDAGNIGAQTCGFTLANCNTQAYVAAVNALNGGAGLCGHNDWRMPTSNELHSIVHYGMISPTVDQTYFPDFTHFPADPFVWAGYSYWSATTDAFLTDHARAVLFYLGWDVSVGKSTARLVRLVRGGTPQTTGTCTAGNPKTNIFESTPTSDFTLHADGTATHNKTGLMWKRCAEGRIWDGTTCTWVLADGGIWSAALSTAEGSTFAGYDDWRLPNAKELYSIIETCGHSPAINLTVFPNLPTYQRYWSATTYAPDTTAAWNVDFSSGDIDGVFQSNKSSDSNFVRLVRGKSLAEFDPLADYTPGAFSFNAILGELSTSYISNAFVVTGINTPSPISIVGGEYSVNFGSFTSAPGGVEAGDIVMVRRVSASTYSTVVTATLTIGGVSAPFSITTKSLDVTMTPNLDFGSQEVGTTSAIKTATITNNGVTPVSILTIDDSGANPAEFDSDPASTCKAGTTILLTNESCLVGMTFTPAATGSRVAFLDVETSVADLHAALSGTGTAPPPPPPPPPEPPAPPLPDPEVVLLVNNIAGGGILSNPVKVSYEIAGCYGKEMFVLIKAPAMGFGWSYVNSSGEFVPLPADLAAITPWMANGPYDGSHILFEGTVPPGDYQLYIGCDLVPNGHLDVPIDGIYGYASATVK